MEKTKIIAVLSACMLLTACGGQADHTHTYASEWSYDDNQHWHAATCEHTDRKSSLGSHSFGQPTEVNGKKVMVCGCGYIKEWNENYVEYSDSFSDVTEFTSPVEIHTEAQKAYLEYTSAYTGEYKDLDKNKYPDGNKTISDPVMTKISWDFADHDEETKYSVTIGQKKDLSDGFEIIGTNAKELNVYNLYLGKNYYRVNAWIDEDTKVGSDVYELTVDETAPRNLYVGTKMTNCRDLGGRVVDSGATIRQGLLLRTCGSGYAMDGVKIDQEGTDILTKQLKVKSEINLNDSGSYNCNFNGVKVYDTFMDYKAQSNTRHHFGRNTENVKNVFSILSDTANYPVFFHCRIGTDRTGLIAILVNGVLGVPLNTIYQDYIFSNFGKIGSKRQIGKGDEDDITNYMNEILAMPGNTFQEKVYNTLITIGVTKDTIAKVEDILLEGTKPDHNKGQIVVEAKDMVFAGTTLKTEDKSSCVNRANPASYATMTTNSTATINFNNTVAGNKEIYAYVGNSNASTTKFSDAISLTFDNSTINVSTKTFKECCMGNVNGRVNYYFVKLGDVANMSAGTHTIVVTGKNNDLNLGTIAVL